MSSSIPSFFRAYLSSSLADGGSETTISLDRITTITGETLETSDWDDFSRGIATLNPDGDGVTTYPELISFTGVDSSGFTGVTRGLDKDGTATASLKRFHPSGTPVIISFTGLGIKDLVTYINSLVVSTRNIIVVGTAGETVAAGNLVYFDDTDNEWKLSDADTASTVENVMLGIAQGAGTDGGLITSGVLLRGMDSNQSSMTAGDIMYAGNTAGAISSSVGTKEVTVGIAKSATELYFSVRFNQMITEDEQDALVGTSGTPSASNKYVTNDDTTGTGTIYRNQVTPSGMLCPYAGATAPAGWLLCDGTAGLDSVTDTTLADLFAVIGTTFGGTGASDFNLPDMRGNFPLGKDNMGGSSRNRVTHANADTIGAEQGAETHQLTVAELASHNHTYEGASGGGGSSNGANTSGSATTGSTGGNTAHQNMSPYMTFNYIIKK